MMIYAQSVGDIRQVSSNRASVTSEIKRNQPEGSEKLWIENRALAMATILAGRNRSLCERPHICSHSVDGA